MCRPIGVVWGVNVGIYVWVVQWVLLTLKRSGLPVGQLLLRDHRVLALCRARVPPVGFAERWKGKSTELPSKSHLSGGWAKRSGADMGENSSTTAGHECLGVTGHVWELVGCFGSSQRHFSEASGSHPVPPGEPPQPR